MISSSDFRCAQTCLVYADVLKSSCGAPLVAQIQKEPSGGGLR